MALTVAVIGAGTAGCVAARRLWSHGLSVDLYEPGSWVDTTFDLAATIDQPSLMWPAAQLGPELVLRARTVGGASAINGGLLSAPDAGLMAAWATRFGLASPAVSDAIDRILGRIDPHPVTPGPLGARFAALAIEAGEPAGARSIDADANGVVSAWVNHDGTGTRRHSGQIFLEGVTEILPPGTDAQSTTANAIGLHTGQEVQRIAPRTAGPGWDLFGESADDGDAAALIGSADVIVLAAGAFGSADLLGASGIAVAHQPPKNHVGVPITVRYRLHVPRAVDQPMISQLIRRVDPIPMAAERSDRRAPWQIVILDHLGAGLDRDRLASMLLIGVGANPMTAIREAFRVVFAHLVHPDMASLIDMVTIGDQIIVDSHDDPAAFARHLWGALLTAGCLDPDWPDEGWIRRNRGPVHHWCASLTDAVDHDGAVLGYDGLYIVDASVLPVLPQADLQLPVMVQADLLCDRLGRHLYGSVAPV